MSPPHLDFYRAARRERNRAVKPHLGDVYEEPKPFVMKPMPHHEDDRDWMVWVVETVWMILTVSGVFALAFILIAMLVMLSTGLPHWSHL